MKRYIFLIIGMLILNGNVTAQDPIFSQYYSAPLQINPAFAGNAYAPHISINYRNQWPDLNAYTTYSAAFDQYIPSLNVGFGLMILTDDAGQGLLKTNKVAGVFAYRLRIVNDLHIKIGTEASWVQNRFNWEEYKFFDQIDPIKGFVTAGGTPIPTEERLPDDPSHTYFDASVGMLLYNRTFYAGIAAKHVNTPDEAVLGINDNLNAGLPVRYTFHAGAQIQIVKGNKRKPSAFISPNMLWIRQGDFGQLNVGAYASYGFIFAGGWYRHARSNADAAIALIGVKKGIYKIGYSYDFSLSKTAIFGQTGGSHEISFQVQLREPPKDFNDCLQLFR